MALTTITKPNETVSEKTSSSENEKKVLTVGENDCLLGRGARATEHIGNVRFRQVVRSRLHDYLTAPRRQDKDRIAREILAVVKSRNGRFLRKVEGMDDSSTSSQGGTGYTVVEDDVSLLKVKQALRDQKLEESTSSNSSKSGSVKSESVKSAGSPTKGPESMIGKMVSPGSPVLKPTLVNASDLLLDNFMKEQACKPLVPQSVFPESTGAALLAARLGLVRQGLPGAVLLEQARQEALLRSALLGQPLQSLVAAQVISPLAGVAAAQQMKIAAMEADAHMKLLQAQSLRRAAGFQEVGDLLDAQRALKRHKAM